MKVFSVIIVAAAVVCGGTLVRADIAAPGQPVYTKQTRFRIPYRYDAAEMQRLAAREIRLYVSYDQGGQWQHVQTVAPDQGRFDFHAPRDGDYWFAVRTLDGKNQLHPPGDVVEPGLRVVVDTQAPSLELSIQQSAPGKVQLSWNASDLYLDPSKLRLEYMQAGVPDWQHVIVVPQAAGQTSWSVPQGGFVAVRGTVSDLAANVGRAQTQLEVSPGSEPSLPQSAPAPSTTFPAQQPMNPAPQQGVPDFRQPIAAAPQHSVPDYRPSINAGSPQQQSMPDFRPSITAAAPQQPQPSLPEYRQSTTPSTPQQSATPVYPPQFIPQATFPSAAAVAPNAGAASTMISETPAFRPDTLQSRYPTAFEAETPIAQRTAGRSRVVNSKRFQIGYKLEDVGPSGVSAVELFITQDQGEKWYKYGNDVDLQSPFEVEVPNDGTFGFAIRVRSGAGLSAEPPQQGERPPIVVVVDQTPPRAQLMPIQQGQGGAFNKLQLRWQIADENPADRPVALYYSANAHGPWEPISGWQEDGGSFLWTVGPSVPTRLYIRLAARDAAGNITQIDTPQPVVVDLSRPSARIVDIESVITPISQQ
jgi:hypothetical protein